MSLCKKHGKERNVIVKSKPSSRGGKVAILEYVGCEDCAAGLPAKSEATPIKKPAVPAVKSKPKKEPPPAEPKKQTPAEAIEQLKKVRTIGQRFGFKF